MSDVLHNHSTREFKPEGTCPGCDQLWATLPRVPAAPGNEYVGVWGVHVADWAVLRPGRCLICNDIANHGGAYCPTGITRQQAEWVRHRREVGLGPAHQPDPPCGVQGHPTWTHDCAVTETVTRLYGDES